MKLPDNPTDRQVVYAWRADDYAHDVTAFRFIYYVEISCREAFGGDPFYERGLPVREEWVVETYDRRGKRWHGEGRRGTNLVGAAADLGESMFASEVPAWDEAHRRTIDELRMRNEQVERLNKERMMIEHRRDLAIEAAEKAQAAS